MAGVTLLRPDEPVRLESARIIELYARLGESGAGSVVARAGDEIAARIAEMERLAGSGQYRAVALSSARLSALAERIGMTTMARVAADVLRAALTGDEHARAATLCRLARIAGRSVSAVDDLGRAIL
ncbi:MAG: hypothetical protein ACKVPY_00395 [Paracoccaceae bacterium]